MFERLISNAFVYSIAIGHQHQWPQRFQSPDPGPPIERLSRQKSPSSSVPDRAVCSSAEIRAEPWPQIGRSCRRCVILPLSRAHSELAFVCEAKGTLFFD